MVPGPVPDVVQPFQKIYQIWIMVWYQGLVPDVVPLLGLEPEMWYQAWYHLFGAGTRDVVPGVLRSLFGLVPDLVPRPGTRAWY